MPPAAQRGPVHALLPQEKAEKHDTEFKHPERLVSLLWNPTQPDGLATAALEKCLRCAPHQRSSAVAGELGAWVHAVTVTALASWRGRRVTQQRPLRTCSRIVRHPVGPASRQSIALMLWGCARSQRHARARTASGTCARARARPRCRLWASTTTSHGAGRTPTCWQRAATPTQSRWSTSAATRPSARPSTASWRAAGRPPVRCMHALPEPQPSSATNPPGIGPTRPSPVIRALWPHD